jgi:AraC family transcriptional regulator of arabinose operon
MMREETIWHAHGDLACAEWTRDASYQNWRPRGGGDWLMIYTVAGEGIIGTPAGEPLRARAGECVLWAPGEPQDYASSPETDTWTLLWAHFIAKPDWTPWLRWPRTSGVRHLDLPEGELRENFHRALGRVHRLHRSGFPGALPLALNALEEAILWARAAFSGEGWANLDPRVRKALDYLAGNLARPFDLDTLARHAGLSVSRLAHLFKRETGTTPQRYLEDLRMRQARQLLRLTNLPVAEIAAEVGYEDAFYFTKRFQRAEGKSPSEFRRNGGRASRPPL